MKKEIRNRLLKVAGNIDNKREIEEAEFDLKLANQNYSLCVDIYSDLILQKEKLDRKIDKQKENCYKLREELETAYNTLAKLQKEKH